MATVVPPRPVTIAAAAFGLGVTAGMRSQIPLALLAFRVHRAAVNNSLAPPLHLLRRRGVVIGLGLSAVGEVVGDKLPVVPSRLRPGPLAGRLGFGGVAGGVLARGAGDSAWLGGALGALGALSGSLAGYTARAQAHRVTGLPDSLFAVLEDGIALTVGLLALSRWPTADESASSPDAGRTIRP